MNRALECKARHARHLGQHTGDESLHVGSAATEVTRVLFGQYKRITVPVLAVDRHDIGVSGKHHAPGIARPNGGVKIGLAAGLVEHQLAVDSEASEVILHVVDQRQVGVTTGCVKSDQVAQ